MNKILISLLLFGYFLSVSLADLPESDRVASLEQMGDLSFGLYSGYLPINGTKK